MMTWELSTSATIVFFSFFWDIVAHRIPVVVSKVLPTPHRSLQEEDNHRRLAEALPVAKRTDSEIPSDNGPSSMPSAHTSVPSAMKPGVIAGSIIAGMLIVAIVMAAHLYVRYLRSSQKVRARQRPGSGESWQTGKGSQSKSKSHYIRTATERTGNRRYSHSSIDPIISGSSYSLPYTTFPPSQRSSPMHSTVSLSGMIGSPLFDPHMATSSYPTCGNAITGHYTTRSNRALPTNSAYDRTLSGAPSSWSSPLATPGLPYAPCTNVPVSPPEKISSIAAAGDECPDTRISANLHQRQDSYPPSTESSIDCSQNCWKSTHRLPRKPVPAYDPFSSPLASPSTSKPPSLSSQTYPRSSIDQGIVAEKSLDTPLPSSTQDVRPVYYILPDLPTVS